MSDTLYVRDQLEVASFSLESYGFHRKHPRQPGPRDGIVGYIQMQSASYQRGVRLLEEILRETPVRLILGEHPLTIHDPMRWQYDHIDDFWEDYGDEVEAAADFYRPVVSLLPNTELVLNHFTEIIGPGDSSLYPYVGNTATSRLIRLYELSDSLAEGSKLTL